jgi:HEAT repeat protein
MEIRGEAGAAETAVAWALEHLVPEGNPFRLEALLADAAAPSEARAEAVLGLKKIARLSGGDAEGLWRAFHDPDPKVREAAIRAIQDLVQEDPSVADRLLLLYRDGGVEDRRTVVDLLRSVPRGSEEDRRSQAVSATLRDALRDPDPALRRAAGEAFYFHGGSSAEDREALRSALEDPDLGVRVNCALAWTWRVGDEIAGADERTTAVFREGLGHEEGSIRGSAIRGLSFLDPSEDTAARLVPLLKDSNFSVRQEAACAFLNFGCNQPAVARGAVPALVEALQDEVIRLRAAEALALIAPEVKDAAPVLKNALEESREPNASAALSLLWIGCEKEAAIRVLSTVLKTGNRDARRGLLWSLQAFSFRKREQFDRVLEIFQHPEIPLEPLLELLDASVEHRNLRLFAILTLGKLGPRASAAIPKLLELLEKEKHGIEGKYAACALVKLGHRSDEVLAHLREALNSPQENIRLSAAFALAEVREELPEVEGILTGALSHPDGHIRKRAEEELGKLRS